MVHNIVIPPGTFAACDVVATALVAAVGGLPTFPGPDYGIHRREPTADELASTSVVVISCGVHDPDHRNYDHRLWSRTSGGHCPRGTTRSAAGSGWPYSTAGLMWAIYGERYIRNLEVGPHDMVPTVARAVDREVIAAIDVRAIEGRGSVEVPPVYALSDIIEAMNVLPGDTPSPEPEPFNPMEVAPTGQPPRRHRFDLGQRRRTDPAFEEALQLTHTLFDRAIRRIAARLTSA